MLDGLEAEPDGQMGLPDAGRTEEHDILAVLDEVTAAQGLDLLLVEGGLVAEVEGLEALDEGETGQVGTHGDVLGGLGGDLLGQQRVEEVGVGGLLGGGLLEHRLQALAAFEEPQPLHLLVQAFELGGAHERTARMASGSTIGRGAAMSVSPVRASQMAKSRISTSGELKAPRALGSAEATRRAVRAIAPGPCSGRMRS